MNAVEYIVLAYGPAQPTKVDADKEQQRAQRQMQQDRDPADVKTAHRVGGRWGGTNSRRR
jgi:hypothetical protein